MSLQNILVDPNKEKLHCQSIKGREAFFTVLETTDLIADSVNIPSLTVDNITTNKIYYEDDPAGDDKVPIIEFNTTDDDSNSYISVNKSIVPTESIGASLGSGNPLLGFKDLYCQNLMGLGLNVNIPGGVLFSNGTTTSQSVLNNYYQLSGTIYGSVSQVPSGQTYAYFSGYNGTSVPNSLYSAMIVGKLVTIYTYLPKYTITSAGPAAIEINALPSIFHPTHDQTFYYSGQYGGTNIGSFLGRVFFNGIIAFYSGLTNVDFPANSTNAGSYPDNIGFTISYMLN